MITINIKQGNLLDVTSGHIVHGCNAKGVMGSGVALAVKKKYPGAFEDYRNNYEERKLVLGYVYPWNFNSKLVIWNAITQNAFGMPGRNCSYDAIENCFKLIDDSIKGEWYESVKKEIHIPFIGAGLGGGSWNIISRIIEDTCSYPVTVWSIDGRMPDGLPI